MKEVQDGKNALTSVLHWETMGYLLRFIETLGVVQHSDILSNGLVCALLYSIVLKKIEKNVELELHVCKVIECQTGIEVGHRICVETDDKQLKDITLNIFTEDDLSDDEDAELLYRFEKLTGEELERGEEEDSLICEYSLFKEDLEGFKKCLYQDHPGWIQRIYNLETLTFRGPAYPYRDILESGKFRDLILCQAGRNMIRVL